MGRRIKTVDTPQGKAYGPKPMTPEWAGRVWWFYNREDNFRHLATDELKKEIESHLSYLYVLGLSAEVAGKIVHQYIVDHHCTKGDHYVKGYSWTQGIGCCIDCWSLDYKAKQCFAELSDSSNENQK